MDSENSRLPSFFPRFFIIGAPKAGTTALSEYLRRHPDILFSTPKEPHFFDDDFSRRHTYTLENYLKCFSDYHKQSMAGEGSALYLLSKSAVPNILRHVPDAKFIVMLRNPVDAVYSFHWQLIYSHEENIVDFEKAWMAQPEQARGEKIPRGNIIREALQYGQVFKYGEQLERLYKLVPREQVKLILFEDFKADTRKIYGEILKFLDVDYYDIQEYEIINRSKKMRLGLIEKPIEHMDRVLRKYGVSTSFGLKRRLKKLNTKYEDRPPLKPGFRRYLMAYYEKDIIRTSQLIGKNLDGWLDE